MNSILDKVRSGLAAEFEAEVSSALDRLTKLCESPIEIALGLAIYMSERLQPQFDPLILCSYEEKEHYGSTARLLIPQCQFDGKRLDFLFRDTYPVRAFIECDGHDFHERTKEQAARDRQRDRQIQQKGVPVLRFTGSEIFSDPTGCANQVFDFIGDMHMRDYILRGGAA